jgi:carotenoid 1,2-hydratase
VTSDTQQPLPAGYETCDAGVDFSQPVADGGYLWWYVDAISDDGQQALTLIMFVGSVFSPYYAAARRRGSAAAEDHCAFNAILYGPGNRKRWTMTERGRRSLRRDAQTLELGPSRATWDGAQLVAEIDERCVPLPWRLRGRITVTPTPLTTHGFALDPAARHRWRPLAPLARVSVDMQHPALRWQGHGYLDSNDGSEPLEQGFADWDWSRETLPDGRCQVRYEARREDAPPRRLSLRFAGDGSVENLDPGDTCALATTPVWRIRRRTLAAAGETPRVLRTLEDTPFYARSLVGDDATGQAVHESLCLRRFSRRWVQLLLPFRMPRLR